MKTELATEPLIRLMMPPRPSDGHKGTFGKVLIGAGSYQYQGAGFLAALAAMRTGSGLVWLLTPNKARQTAALRLPEAIYPIVPEDEVLWTDAAKWLENFQSDYSAILLGPGLSRADRFIARSLEALRQSDIPLVLDADGLNGLARQRHFLKSLPPQTILTPHMGEMASLIGLTRSQISEIDRIEATQEKAAEWGCVILLKGAYTVIAAPNGRTVVLPFANPLLATAGSGDVLSGVIAALAGRGLNPFDAAVLGGWIHASAGELGRERFGESGMLASELADLIPIVTKGLVSN